MAGHRKIWRETSASFVVKITMVLLLLFLPLPVSETFSLRFRHLKLSITFIYSLHYARRAKKVNALKQPAVSEFNLFRSADCPPTHSAWHGNRLEIGKPLVLGECCELGQFALRATYDTAKKSAHNRNTFLTCCTGGRLQISAPGSDSRLSQCLWLANVSAAKEAGLGR